MIDVSMMVEHLKESAVGRLSAIFLRRHPAVRRLGVVMGACALIGLTLAACSSPSNSSEGGGAKVKGGTVTFAEPPGVIPNWILPFVGTSQYSYFGDFDWDWQMWRPVYFVGTPTSPDIDYSESLAYKPVFSDNDTVFTITLKPWKWSDGTPITARNVLFFFNLLKVEKSNWWLYVPGSFPDNVKSVKILSQRVIQFTLDQAENPEYFDQNDAQNLTPLPLAWDRTSLTGQRGNGNTVPAGTGQGLDMTAAGAKAVYNFLVSQSENVSTYASNWLWKITDGPFKLATYNVDGQTSLVPNKLYGGVQPSISELTFLPFTSEISEFSELDSTSSIDVGYVSYSDAATAKTLSSYSLAPWRPWAYSFITPNYNNPAAGPIFKQLYVRQAMQDLIDQTTIDQHVWDGYGTPSEGTAPLTPANPYLTPQMKAMPYKYDPTKAVSLLKQNGWTVHPGGTSVCSKPGSGPGECGTGIKAGTPLSFTLAYNDSVPEDETQAVVEKTDEDKAGINLSLRPETAQALYTDNPRCTPAQSACSWQLVSGEDYTPYPYPYAGLNLYCGSVLNNGSYCSSEADTLMNQARSSPVPDGLSSAFFASENYLLQQVPDIYQPETPYQLTMVKNDLHGVTPQSPELAITPELWYYTKS